MIGEPSGRGAGRGANWFELGLKGLKGEKVDYMNTERDKKKIQMLKWVRLRKFWNFLL